MPGVRIIERSRLARAGLSIHRAEVLRARSAGAQGRSRRDHRNGGIVKRSAPETELREMFSESDPYSRERRKRADDRDYAKYRRAEQRERAKEKQRERDSR